MTAPKPYSDAVFTDASSAPPTAARLASAARGSIRDQARSATLRQPAISAASTDQIATTDLSSTRTGAAWPGRIAATDAG